MEARTAPGELQAMTSVSEVAIGEAPPSVLDRVIPLGGASIWQTLGWIAAFAVALGLRFVALKGWALDASEASWAYDAWALFRGQPPVTGGTMPNVSPLLLLLQSASFFLFGATDVTARLVPALTGLALVALPLACRRWLGGPAALGIAATLAVSPTLVYASRVVSPEILVAVLALACVVCLVRLGERDLGQSPRGLAIALGIIAGADFAAGPSAITVGVTLVVGLAAAALTAPRGTVRRGLQALRRELPAFLLAGVVTVALLFTRFLSNPNGIAGVGETVGAWWQLLAGTGSGQPVQLFFLALLIYEPLAVLFAIVAAVRNDRPEATALGAGWFLAAFALWSFSAGRQPEHAVHVALPLLLLAGIGLGHLLHEIDWRDVWHGIGGLLALAMLGLLVGLAPVGILLRRAGATADAGGALPPVAVLCLVVVPLVYVIWRLRGDEREAGHARQPARMALLVLAVLLGAFALRSATLLVFDRAAVGIELLAQRTATLGTLPSVERLLRLARDVGVNDGSERDPTGGHDLSIALERDVASPYVWYFREFPDLAVVDPGTAAASGSQVVIAASDAGFGEGGYAAQTWPWLNTVPPQYLAPDMGSILSSLVTPSRWLPVWRYLLFREGIAPPQPQTVAVGLAPELAQRVSVSTGPYDLSDRPGPGTQPGQFKDPIGIAIAPDGTIDVVDSGNGRVQRFDANGKFLGIWGEENGVTFTRTENGLGPTGITIAPDGRTWVADTWGHRVIALDANGNQVQAIGGETIDLGNDPARVDEDGGRFFGPRAIAITDDAIYVVDTGNERVQRFNPDGTFVDAWGGYGTAPDQLIEPVGIAIGPDGNLYVADSGNARISIFTPQGQPVAQWPVAAWPPPNPSGLPPAFQPYLAFDAAGNLYATASNAGEVLVFDRNGKQITQITEAGAEHLAQPIGIAIAANGDVYLADVGRDAVFTVTPPNPLDAENLDSGSVSASPAP
jgi:DNA-binding beta-propeller fold protein YncE/4-amino-4-deoxy-L-arabinose transferase-like glycosyltransferase